MEKGPVTESYRADVNEVVAVLNEALATEIVCILRYKRHYYMASGINAAPVAAEFLQHANEEQQHADWIAERITQLQGSPTSTRGITSRPTASTTTSRRPSSRCCARTSSPSGLRSRATAR